MMRRIMLLAQKELGERCFEIIQNNNSDNIELLAVVSNKSKKVWWGTNGIFESTKQSKIQFIDNKKPNEDLIYNTISKYNINTIISVQHSWILSERIINSVNGFAFNLHNAKLPYYKGNNIFSHVILNDEIYHTSTVHFIIEDVDMGDIVLEKKISVLKNDTSKSLYYRAQKNAEKLFSEFLKIVDNGSIVRKKIVNNGTFYKRNSLDGLREIIDPTSYEEMDKKSRAFCFHPFEPSYCIIGDKKFYILPESYFKKK